MAEILSLRGEPSEQPFDEGQELIKEELEGLLEANEKGQINSIFIMIANPDGQTSIAIRRSYADSVAFLGQLEILKSDILSRMRELKQ